MTSKPSCFFGAVLKKSKKRQAILLFSKKLTTLTMILSYFPSWAALGPTLAPSAYALDSLLRALPHFANNTGPLCEQCWIPLRTIVDQLRPPRATRGSLWPPRGLPRDAPAAFGVARASLWATLAPLGMSLGPPRTLLGPFPRVYLRHGAAFPGAVGIPRTSPALPGDE